MAGKSNSRRWILLALVALGVVVAATLPRSGSDEAEQDAEPTDAREASGRQALPSDQRHDGGAASRRIAEGCDPIDESLKYEEFIGRRAHAILSWNGMSERAANLKIPVHVVGIENGAIGVRFMDFPMRAQYLGIWLGSEHLEKGPKDVFLLDPCSATIVAWPAMEQATGDGDEDFDEDGLVTDEFLGGE